MEHSPSSDTNRGGGDFFTTVDALLSHAHYKHGEPPHAIEWHERAEKLASSLESRTIHDDAVKLLDQHHYTELIDILSLPEDERHAELTTIRRYRRLFLVARDGLILTTEKHRTTEYSALRIACFALGRFVDSNASDQLYAITARGSVRTLATVQHESHNYLHDDQRLRIKYLQALDGMGVNELFHASDARQDFHQRRKTFRRAVNTIVLHAATNQDESSLALAKDGLRINTAMGRIDKTLKNNQ